MAEQHFVSVLMGSRNDLAVMKHCVDVLESYAITSEVRVLSAHRTPAETVAYVRDAESRGAVVFVAAAGLAAHLAGTVAAHTVRPVVGVPLSVGALQGMDALLSTAQMPAGVPVATMAIGEHGAKNAAHFAAQLMGLLDEDAKGRILDQRQARAAAVLAQNEQVDA